MSFRQFMLGAMLLRTKDACEYPSNPRHNLISRDVERFLVITANALASNAAKKFRRLLLTRHGGLGQTVESMVASITDMPAQGLATAYIKAQADEVEAVDITRVRALHLWWSLFSLSLSVSLILFLSFAALL